MADLLQAGALVPVLPDHRLEAVDVNLISHGRTRDTPAVALLAEFLAAETAGLGDAGQGFQPA